MTLLMGCVSVLLTVILGTGASLVGRAAIQDAHAQLAADATALAAVAEMGPGGSGQPEPTARRYAALNHARLVRCTCVPGAGAVQVTVAVDGVLARARAEIELSLLGSAQIFAGVSGLQPEMRAAVSELIEAGRGSVRVISGLRSEAEQSVLWADALATYGDPEIADDWVARPGHSMHERGLAVDLGGDLALARRLIVELGLPLRQPLPHEPGHYELDQSRA